MDWRGILAAIVAFGACLRAETAEIPFERTEDFCPVTIGDRVRQTPRTRFYAETVGQYSLFQNFLHRWLDRPLFTDRALRPANENFAYDTPEAYAIARASARQMGLDGFAVFGNFRNSQAEFLRHQNWCRGADGAFGVFPMAFYTLGGVDFKGDPEGIAALVKVADDGRAPGSAANAALVRTTDGRLMMGVYNLDQASTTDQTALIAKVHALAPDVRFALPGQLDVKILRRLMKNVRLNGALTGDERRELAKLVDDSLAGSDGLFLRMTEYHRTAEGSYASFIDQNLFDKELKPILKAAYQKPGNARKTLGFYAMQGYLNNLSGSNHGEFGTATLRHVIQSLLEVNPDAIVFFEWNEENESTMFQPTVRNGLAISRLIRYYAGLVRGEAPSPLEGDDNTVPNLTLSHRIVFKPGERIEFEILNIPSGEAARQHEVQLSLYTGTGARLAAFPKERMKTDVLGAITYAVPGEAFPVESAVVPVLTVDGRRYGGFHPLRVDATRCVDYKCVRQSLRDQPRFAQRKFRLKAAETGVYDFSVELSGDEPLRSVELVCNEDEVAAYDRENEFDRTRFDIVRLSLLLAPGASVVGPVTLRLKNAGEARIVQDWKPNVNPGRLDKTPDGAWRPRLQLFNDETPYFVLVPKGRLPEAVLTVVPEEPFGDGREELNIPLGTVAKTGCFEVAGKGPFGFRAEARLFDALPDHPLPIARKDVRWQGRVRVATPAPQFHVRAITASGKVWRSKVVAPTSFADAPRIRLPVYSEWTKGARDVDVPAALVPVVDYDFSPACGDAIAAKGRPEFNGSLGGGYVYCEAFCEKKPFVGMSEGFANQPRWIRDAERWILRFDGDNDYVHLPLETFPVGAFGLEAEFRPHLTERNMVIFRHAGVGRASLQLFAVKGRLFAMWADRDYENPVRNVYSFDTGLEIRTGEWNALSVGYDFRRIVFRLNGKEKAFPFNRRAYFFQASIFGAHCITTDIAPRGPLECFRGDLRRLVIRHAPGSAFGKGGKRCQELKDWPLPRLSARRLSSREKRLWRST